MKKLLPLLALPLTLLPLCRPAAGAATDIVPTGSATLDTFAALARADAFGAEDTPEDFLGESLYTRGQLARLLEHLIQDEPQRLARVQKNDAANAALHAATDGLGAELKADGVDLSEIDAAPASGATVGGYVQPELRVGTGGGSGSKTGALGVYRVTAQGSLRSNLRYVVSASNWAQDARRVFNNDIGAHDFSAVNEAYLELNGGRGLTLSLGRQHDRWGPGYRGATMISDNAPAFDQLQVAFPFSLGARLGRGYDFTQFAATFKEGGTRKYLEARRIGFAFSPHLSADFQEAFKSSSSRALEVTLLPDFYTAQSANLKVGNLRITGLDQTYNAFLNFGLSYAADPNTRVYGQLGIDDIQTPGRRTYRTPRKIAQLFGVAFQPASGTGVVAEYTFADATTYSSRIPDTQWQKGLYDEIGLPSGPNSRELFLRLSQKLARGLTASLQGRDRRRRDDSFPAPTSRDLAATLEFAPDKQNGFSVTYHDYRQQPFPLPSSVLAPGDGFTPANAEGNYGQSLRIKQLDVAYRFFF
jgi:hypothetical protein